MSLPRDLQDAIESQTADRPLARIGEARKELTERYRGQEHEKKGFMTSEDHRLSYVAARMPATYQVVRKVLQELKVRAPGQTILSHLDLGAGPGTAMWAAAYVFPPIEEIHVVERDPDLASMGKRIASQSEQGHLKKASWELMDLKDWTPAKPYHLVTMSYVIGELGEKICGKLIEKGWLATEKFFVVIEPGTPAGFERIRAARSQLISLGAHLAAPCPHAETCPMTGGDWCHFSERVERSFLHRKTKQATLGFEDEKFSYVIASKTPCNLPQGRILRPPLKRSGHIHLTLCAPGGIKQEIVSKKSGDCYKTARKLEWGDAIEND